MNAIVNGVIVNPERGARPAPHATHKLKLLLRREFWEHKGGFLWAPIWAGGISLLLTLMALIVVHLLGVLKDRLVDGGAAWSRMAGRQ